MCFYLYSSGNDLSAMCMPHTPATPSLRIRASCYRALQIWEESEFRENPPPRVPLRPDMKGVSQGDHMVHSSPKRIACPLF